MSNTIPSMTDRRKNRSQELQQAVTYQLEHVLERFDLEFLAVGDRDGFHVAGAGRDAEDSLLAAFAPAITSSGVGQRKLLKKELMGYLDDAEDSVVEVREFTVGGQSWYLCMVSSRGSDSEEALEHTVTGIQRIFRTLPA